jgi:hypothetical protein
LNRRGFVTSFTFSFDMKSAVSTALFCFGSGITSHEAT